MKLVGEKSQDHQQLEQVRDKSRLDVRAPEKSMDLWSREKHSALAPGGGAACFSPASERHGTLMGEAGPLAAELPPASLPGPWSIP